MANILVPPRFEDIIADEEMYFSSQSARATDFNPGSAIRTILEVVAQIQERRDVAVWASLERAIDEAVFDAWGFPRQEAIPATGQLTLFPGVGQNQPITVRQGDLFRVPDSPTLVYEAVSTASNVDGLYGWDSSLSTETVWITNPAMSAATINVRAIVPGKTGNVGARLITQAFQPIPGIAEIKNLQAFTNGVDASTEADRRAAFTAYLQSLPRGTVASLKYGAKTAIRLDNFGLVTEQVRKAAIIEGTSFGVPLVFDTFSATLFAGQVGVIIDNGTGNMSAELLAACTNIINGYTDDKGIKHDGYKAAGIITNVYAAKHQNLAIHVDVTVAKGFQIIQVVELVKLAIQNAINILDVGETLLYTDLLMFLKLVPGVLDVTNLTITGGPVDRNGLLVLSSIAGTATLDNLVQEIKYPQSV